VKELLHGKHNDEHTHHGVEFEQGTKNGPESEDHDNFRVEETVCMHVCMCVCMKEPYVDLKKKSANFYLEEVVCMHVCMYVCMYVCM
jgi:hypothetical protein